MPSINCNNQTGMEQIDVRLAAADVHRRLLNINGSVNNLQIIIPIGGRDCFVVVVVVNQCLMIKSMLLVAPALPFS